MILSGDDAELADRGNGFPVVELWVYITVYGPNDEGTTAVYLPQLGVVPCVFAKQEMAEKVRPLVVAGARGKRTVLRKFVWGDVDISEEVVVE